VADDEVVEALRIVASAGTLPLPAKPGAVAAAEEAIGFSLPPLLRRLYVEVANGGFGAKEGILGVGGGAAQSNFADVAELYQDGSNPSGRIPVGLVLIYAWGCAIWSLFGFRDPGGAMWCNHEGECWPQGVNLAEWLTGTLAGTLTVETVLESQPSS
jgi:hypothetical protein